MQNTNLEDIYLLIAAVRKYREELAENRKLILDAVNACVETMGDEISKKYGEKVNSALRYLDNTAQLAEDVIAELTADASRIENDILAID